MTFNPPPDQIIRPQDAPLRLTPHERKVALLLECGADAVATARTDRALLGMEAQEFIRDVLLARFAPRHLVEGPNFFFGRKRSGNIATLQEAGERLGFGVHVVEAVMVELGGQAERVSSTLTRRLVAAGRVEEAAGVLTRPFSLYGPVVRGQGVGRQMEYPTANLEPGEQVVPADGVYAGRGVVDGTAYPAAISIGTRPTLGELPRAIEAYLIGVGGDLYGREMELAFVRRLREQKTCASIEDLKRQIAADIRQTLEIVGHE